jgi:hypothetical protein
MNEINFVINLTTWEGGHLPLTPALSLRERAGVRGKRKMK